jgi:hypothetical protein
MIGFITTGYSFVIGQVTGLRVFYKLRGMNQGATQYFMRSDVPGHEPAWFMRWGLGYVIKPHFY